MSPSFVRGALQGHNVGPTFDRLRVRSSAICLGRRRAGSAGSIAYTAPRGPTGPCLLTDDRPGAPRPHDRRSERPSRRGPRCGGGRRGCCRGRRGRRPRRRRARGRRGAGQGRRRRRGRGHRGRRLRRDRGGPDARARRPPTRARSPRPARSRPEAGGPHAVRDRSRAPDPRPVVVRVRRRHAGDLRRDPGLRPALRPRRRVHADPDAFAGSDRRPGDTRAERRPDGRAERLRRADAVAHPDRAAAHAGSLTPARWALAAGSYPRPMGGRADGSREAALAKARASMVAQQLERRGIRDRRVLEAMGSVPREAFVPGMPDRAAYDDRALPIERGQTISQPYIVARMTELLGVEPGDRVLEVGTGSGYQAAVLARLGARVVSIERHETLARAAAETLRALGIDGVAVRVGDGSRGDPDGAPWDGIVVTAAAPDVPAELREQLAIGGRLVIPVGGRWEQDLVVVERRSDTEWKEQSDGPVVFVPLVGEGGWREG